eukprot:5996335-Amphidinium_carterae.1
MSLASGHFSDLSSREPLFGMYGLDSERNSGRGNLGVIYRPQPRGIVPANPSSEENPPLPSIGGQKSTEKKGISN